MFINLGDNAIKFTPSGGSVTYKVSAATGTAESSDGDDVGFALMSQYARSSKVRVLDTGIGIPPSERQKVFDPFYQVDSSSTREHGGTGLGLAIVKRLVESHEGTVRVDENTPRGAMFVVTLPLGT